MERLCINSSEVAELLGKSQTTAQTILRTIKDAYGKKKYQVITIKEFCDYQGLPYEEVFLMINKKKKK
ncbi:MAG: hypothetical protein ACSHXF_13340 [Aquaticitalea sp.]